MIWNTTGVGREISWVLQLPWLLRTADLLGLVKQIRDVVLPEISLNQTSKTCICYKTLVVRLVKISHHIHMHADACKIHTPPTASNMLLDKMGLLCSFTCSQQQNSGWMWGNVVEKYLFQVSMMEFLSCERGRYFFVFCFSSRMWNLQMRNLGLEGLNFRLRKYRNSDDTWDIYYTKLHKIVSILPIGLFLKNIRKQRLLFKFPFCCSLIAHNYLNNNIILDIEVQQLKNNQQQ